jgi:flagellar motility protein MotE (MotC chaperone)
MELTEQQFVAAVRRYFGLSEAVRSDASLEAQREALAAALNEWPLRPSNDLFVVLTFPDRLIAFAWSPEMEERQVWEIPWQEDGAGGFTFGTPVAVKEVRLYEPITESAKPVKGQRFTETIEQTLTVTESKTDGGGRKVKAIGITADVVNANGRRYPRKVLAEAVSRLNGHLHESNGQGQFVTTGEAEHPSDKGQRANILETVVKWQAASLDAPGKVLLEGVILPTAKGRDVQVLVEAGVPIGVSMRGYGTSRTIQLDGESVQEVTELTIKGFDLVAQPSDPNGAIVEAQQDEEQQIQEAQTVTEEEKKALEEKQRQLQAELDESKKALADQGKQLEEARKAEAELAARKQAEAVETAITESTKDLKYGDALNGAFVEAVRSAKPADAAAVKAIVEAKRVEYDAIVSAAKLGGMGKSGVEVKGPVFEKETGHPEFTRAAWELTESLVKAGEATRRDFSKPDQPRAALFAAAALERFDRVNQRHLLAEARAFEEAETAADLSLPYSVSRMIIEQAYPELVAANVYDFGVTDVSPAKIFYEAYAGEVGASVTVTDEAVTASLLDWVALANKRVRPGTVVVTHTSGSPTYAEGTDYVIDYEEGKILALATITESQSVKVDYVADLFRRGEGVAIPRAKNTLSDALITMYADRLATQITKEAIIFSRSQLGYDAVTRTLGNLARLLRRKIDKDILWKGLTYALKQANNSGGTWTAASDAISILAGYIGIAKVKVHNRNYMPTGILMSATNADRLSNWTDGFKRDGFPNAVLNAAGFAGGVKGLPIYMSTEFPDGYIQIVNRELVMHRVMQPMTIYGPFPSYDNGLLVAQDQYYMEEFNGSFVPVPEKTSYVKVA